MRQSWIVSNPVKLAFWVGQSLIEARGLWLAQGCSRNFAVWGGENGLFAVGPCLLRLDQPVSDGVADQTGCVMDIEFLHQVGTVGFRGLDTDVEQRSDFLGGFSLSHQLQYLAFPVADGLPRDFGVLQECLDNGAGDALRQKHLSSAHCAKSKDQLARGPCFEHVSGNSGAQALQDQVVFRVHGKQHNFCARIGFYDLARRVNSVQERHGQIENRNFRMMGLTQSHGFATIGSFAHHLKSFSLQKNSQTLADYLVIVRKQYVNCHLRNPATDRKLRAQVNGEMVPAGRALSLQGTVGYPGILQLTPSRKQNIH